MSGTSFQLVHAAIRRRKPVLVVDLGGTGGLPGALARVCADAGAPLHVFGPDGQGCYEPLRGGDPARKAALVMGMIDWAAVADHARRTCGACLNDLFAVAAAAPGDPRVPVLDDVAALLGPAALRARMRQVPPYHPRRGPLGERVRVSASLLEADPATASFLAGELTGLRASVLGRWLRPGAAQSGAPRPERCWPARGCCPDQPQRGGPRARGRVLPARPGAARPFRADDREPRGPRPHRGVRRITAPGGDGDGLAWLGDGDALAPPALAQLLAAGAGAGLATVVSTGPAAAARQIAARASVLVIRGPGDPGLDDVPLDGVPLAGDEFALVVKGPEPQVVRRGRFVPGRIP